MKQTAVEWLLDSLDYNQNMLGIKEIIEEAKEMEKEQIIEAHGNKLKKSRDTGNYEYWFTGLDYYYKTFKKTEQ